MAKKKAKKKFRNNVWIVSFSLFNLDGFSFSLSGTDLKTPVPWTNETLLCIFSWLKWRINTIYACLCVASQIAIS